MFSVSTAVLDLEHSQESLELISRFTYTGRFNVVRTAQTQADITRAIDQGDATVAIIVYPRFAEYLRNGQSAPIQVIVDGTNSNTAMIALGYAGQIVSPFSQDYASDLATRLHGGQHSRIVQVLLEQRPWYNPDLNSRWFFVPGVIATLTLTPAGRGYGWLRGWALSGVIVCQLVVDIAAPVLRTRCCGGLFRPRREP